MIQHLTPADTAVSPKTPRQKSFHETIEVTELQYLDIVDEKEEEEGGDDEDYSIEKFVRNDSLFDYGAGWNDSATSNKLNQRKR